MESVAYLRNIGFSKKHFLRGVGRLMTPCDGLIVNIHTPEKTVESKDICMCSYWQLCTWTLSGEHNRNNFPEYFDNFLSSTIKWTVTLSWPTCQAVHLFPSSRMSQGAGGALISLMAVKHITTSGSNLITFAASQHDARAAQSATPSERDARRRK